MTHFTDEFLRQKKILFDINFLYMMLFSYLKEECQVDNENPLMGKGECSMKGIFSHSVT